MRGAHTAICVIIIAYNCAAVNLFFTTSKKAKDPPQSKQKCRFSATGMQLNDGAPAKQALQTPTVFKFFHRGSYNKRPSWRKRSSRTSSRPSPRALREYGRTRPRQPQARPRRPRRYFPSYLQAIPYAFLLTSTPRNIPLPRQAVPLLPAPCLRGGRAYKAGKLP